MLIASLDRDRAPLIIPLALAVGTAVAAYGGWLAGAAYDPDNPVAAPPTWQSALRLLLVGSVITLALFWEVSNFASVVGRGYAQQIARRPVSGRNESRQARTPAMTPSATAPLGSGSWPAQAGGYSCFTTAGNLGVER